MTFNNDSHLLSVSDISAFFKYIIEERNIMFHPDDQFEADERITSEEALLWNRLMDEAFDICDKEGVDIYELCMPLALSAIQ